ncbi:MAG: ATP-grasp domain-containing protein, partial [Bacteroidia bacterium]
LKEAQDMADKVTKSLTGVGLWGVEFFLSDKQGVYFSELSPRPHDTGMVTLAGTQNFSEFELHARVVLGLPIPEIVLERVGASAVILASKEGKNPTYSGIEEAISRSQTDIRIFGKPTTRPYRRMAVALSYDKLGSDVHKVKERAVENAKKVKVNSN